MYFSKSKYCDFCQCGKLSWLKKYKPELLVTDDSVMARFAEGNKAGDLAMGYFGDFTEVTVYKDGKPDLNEMIRRTQSELQKNTPVICEASFSFGGLYCAVDILRREDDGWSIYEVKSSTHGDKDVYMTDIAYQRYVLEHCGINVKNTYVMCIDNTYVFDGKLEIKKLFKVTDVTERVAKKLPLVGENLKKAEKILNSADEPDIAVGLQCSTPYDCPFWNYCTRDLPKPNVFDLYRIGKKDAFGFLEKGLVTFEDLANESSIDNKIQKLQLELHNNKKDSYIDKEKLRGFLNKLTYPLYFLDFESFMPVIPKYAGTVPYQQIPFQYSLHYIESEGGELKHREFLADPKTEPFRPIAEALCRDIPKDVTVFAYSSFENTALKKLAGRFPDLSEHLRNIAAHIVDLLTPFRSGWYYNTRMNKSFSVKSVLPAIFPDDPSLDYHNLEGIQNGCDAMTVFPRMENMEPEELEKTRDKLLKYCGLDTLAMVKLWEALNDAAK